MKTKGSIVALLVLLGALCVVGGDVIVKNGEVNATANITAYHFFGDGSALTNIPWNINQTQKCIDWVLVQGYLTSSFNSTYDQWAYNQTDGLDYAGFYTDNGWIENSSTQWMINQTQKSIDWVLAQGYGAGSSFNLSIELLTSGTVYTTPVGCKALMVTAYGAGGGGGAANSSLLEVSVAGGGSAGGKATFVFTNPNATYSYAIGAAGVASNTTGMTGGDTTFGGVVTAKGGTGGMAGLGSTTFTVRGGGAGQSGNVGTVTGFGERGQSGSGYYGVVYVSGGGGNSDLGYGGNPKTSAAAGNAGNGYSSGGGGAISLNAGGLYKGGVGKQGAIVVLAYY